MATPEVKQASETEMTDQPKREEVAALAYQYWEESGCVDGADQEHWYRAEQKLREQRETPVSEGPAKASAGTA